MSLGGGESNGERKRKKKKKKRARLGAEVEPSQKKFFFSAYRESMTAKNITKRLLGKHVRDRLKKTGHVSREKEQSLGQARKKLRRTGMNLIACNKRGAGADKRKKSGRECKAQKKKAMGFARAP